MRVHCGVVREEEDTQREREREREHRESRMAMKRKELEEPELVLEDLSRFPISSRTTKIRRLDAEVAPVVTGGGEEELQMVMDGVPVNEERATVVYNKPAVDAARNFLLGPLRPAVTLGLTADWIHGLKNRMLNEASNRSLEGELAQDKNSSLAIVPWVPARASTAEEMMDADDTEGASMEVEDNRGQFTSTGGARGHGFHQWPQHCMVPQEIPAVSQPSPVMWSW